MARQPARPPVGEIGYRVVVAVVGFGVLAVGTVAMPYPGPGWAIVFIGLAILATEFDWARPPAVVLPGAL